MRPPDAVQRCFGAAVARAPPVGVGRTARAALSRPRAVLRCAVQATPQSEAPLSSMDIENLSREPYCDDFVCQRCAC